ncbi:MAG: diguanylate cyclase, partial [Rhodospirillales bacterium]
LSLPPSGSASRSKASTCCPTPLPHPVTVSIGVSLCGDDPAQLDRDIVTADKALYTAKKNGRNRVEISPRFSDPGAAHRQESIRTG